MNFKSHTKIFTILLALLFANIAAPAQTTAPRQEKLLNGMKLLVWNAPAEAKVSVKLRVHSGAAFDTLGKEGTMALLADTLFPTAAAKEFFTEDLGGSLDVTSNYDYIQINATANNEQFLTMLETLANAVTNAQTDKETTAKVRAAHLEKIRELEKNPSYVADRAVAKRLFGDFPYGRPPLGTSESIAKIDFADLTLAKQRFLTADNATLAIVGNVKPDLAYRAVRRFFGAWTQADKRVPATFKQMDAPVAKEFSIELPNAEKYSTRAAFVSVARSDKDFYAMRVLTDIWQNQFCYSDAAKNGAAKFESYLLRGAYVVAQDKPYSDKNESPAAGRNPCLLLLVKDGKTVYPPISPNDFADGKARITAEYQQKIQTLADSAEMWLDVDTFRLVSVKDEMSKLSSVTLADVRRVAEELQKQPIVSVVVKKSEPARTN